LGCAIPLAAYGSAQQGQAGRIASPTVRSSARWRLPKRAAARRSISLPRKRGSSGLRPGIS
jgi:hypothetical protein